MKEGKNKGFTLVEILVVLGIVAILAALLFPVVGSMIREAKSARCIGNLRQIAAALMVYRADNNGQVVPFWLSGGGGLHPSVPLDAYYMGNTGGITATALQSHAWSCPANPAVHATPLTNFYEDTSDSYAVNSSLIDNANARGVYASAISHPATLFLILERDTSKKPHGTTVSRNNIKIDKVGYYGHPGGGDTVAFVDGHIESLPATHPGMEGSNGTSSTAWTNYWLP